MKKEGTESCGHVCGVLLPCDHACQAVCHDAKVSPHTKECKAKVDIKCLCGRMTHKIPCYQYSQKSRSLAGKRGGSGWRTPTIPCDTECQHEERMSSFASALGIDKSRDSELAFQGANSLTPLRSTVYNQTIWLALQQQTQHVRLLERTFDDFLIEVSRTRMMQPMNEEKRRVVHELAAYYGLTVQTFDQEPNKTCQLTKTPHTKKPVPLLSEWKQDPLELAQVCCSLLTRLPSASHTHCITHANDTPTQTRATDYPESVIVFQEITNPDKYRECIKVLRPYVGRWIGFKKVCRHYTTPDTVLHTHTHTTQGGTMYCVAFMDTQDAQVCFNNLTKDKVPIKFQLLLDHNQDQAARQAAGVSAGAVFSGGAAGTTKVFTSGGRRSQMAAASGAPPPTGGSGGTWAGRSGASSVPQAYQPPALPLASTRWESLGKKK